MAKNKKTNFIPFGILVICFGIMISIYYINRGLKLNSIESSNGICPGRVTLGNYIGRPAAFNLFYSYTVNGTHFENVNSEISIHKDNIKFFVGKEFPVIYSNNNPKRSMLLVFPENFEFWGLPFPDSLEWVNQYHSVY